MKTLVIALGLIAFSAAKAVAVDLINRDSGSYEVKIVSSTGTTSTSISGLSTRQNVCSGGCQIEVKGVGTIRANGDDKVVISGSSLKKE